MNEHKAAETIDGLLYRYETEPMTPETMHAMATDLRNTAHREQDPRWKEYFHSFADIVQEMYTPERMQEGRNKLANLKWPVAFVMKPADLNGHRMLK